MTAPRWEDVAASIDRAQRNLDNVPMPCTETQLAILELQTAEQLVGDAIDAALARLAEPERSAEGATAAEQLMREVCEALGWQGGTRDGALAAIRQAKRAADAAEAYDRELNETGGAGPAALIRESAAWRRVR